jgi:hypothetical protein
MNVCSIFRGRRNKFIIAISGTAALLFAACIFLRIHRPRDLESFFEMAGESPPVWRQFAVRRFGVGDSTAKLLQKYPPTRREEFGRYGIYQYGPGDSNSISYTGLTVASKDGKLISAGAWSCTWQFVFFSTKDSEIGRQYDQFLKERHDRRKREYLGKLDTDLRKFYSHRGRWPEDPREFSQFVTGSPSETTNDLGITLVQRPDGLVDIALISLPGEKRSVAKPVE